ncbi:MAG TPA: Gldg family protein [Myxococcota bacterium]|jgi:ABC-type uncharacterized transport system involved in gliding motility auxiliary subunit|nr:Gldg family protein [Myxococcota bacterium]
MTGLPSLLAALGLVGIAFALLSFVLVLFSGAGLASDLGWIGANLVVGLGLLVTSVTLSWSTLRERMSSGEARRAGRYGSSAVVGTLVAIAILGMLGFLASRYHKKYDWTESGIHTLSDQSQKVLANLDGDVEVLALVSKVDSEPVRALLDKYADVSPRFKVEYADPNVRPGLLEQYGITPDELGKGLVRIAIGGDAVKLTELDEEKVTNAMVKLTRTGQKIVYFLDGHGEKPIDGEAANARDGYGRAAEALRNENYTAKPLLLASTGEVPADADAVIIAGPRRPLLPEETKALEAYLAKGGAVLVLLDPRVHTEFVAQLASWGVELGDDVVIDRTLALFGRAMSPFADSYDPAHEITRGLRDPTLFHEVRSVKAGPGFTEIVFTGNESWAERDLAMLDADGKAALDPTDLAGPVPVAVAGTPTLPADATPPAEPAAAEGEDAPVTKAARLVVFGDVDFADNEFIEAYSNRNLFVNSVNWLIGDVEAISIRPAQSRASRFQLSAEQFRTIRWLSLFVLPQAIAILGVFTWWSRRHSRSS